MAAFLINLAKGVNFVFSLYYWIIIVRVVLGWINIAPLDQYLKIAKMITEPVLAPIRAFLPMRLLHGIDFSPFIAIILILIIKTYLSKVLIEFSKRF